MKKRFIAVLAAVVAAVPAAFVYPTAQASPSEQYAGPYFGDGNFPPGCIRDMSLANPANICHHMKVDLNALDSPQVDVLVMVPVSPTAERDMRIMRQSIEMWEGGIDYLAREMGLDWLADGMDFHITVDAIDLTGGQGGEFTTYPVVDPEIVVIASNPVGGAGIGIDPVNAVFTNENLVPCHSVANPFDFEYWDNLPGFDRHHDSRSGTYKEDCGGSGGNVCFAVNGAIDPDPTRFNLFSLFEVVNHEVGHCLTLGHVGDGTDGSWGVVPRMEIMAYTGTAFEQLPVGVTKCASTLDVEGVAVRMSNYLDVNGDGAVNNADKRLANDQIGDGRSIFQVQHPDDHLYASSTGLAADCPRPDLGLVPGPRTDWSPTPIPGTPQPPACGPGHPVLVDKSGDATDVILTTPLPSEPALDIVDSHASWVSATTTAVFQFRVTDLPPMPGQGTTGTGEYFDYEFTYGGQNLYLAASRTIDGGTTFGLGRFSTTRQTLATGLTGSFDHVTDTVTVNLSNANLASVTAVALPPMTTGSTFSDFSITSRRDLGAVVPNADTAVGRCNFTVA